MDAQQIHNLFDDQKIYKKYIKRDYVKIYSQQNVNEKTSVSFTCHTLVNKLIDYSDAFLLFTGTIMRDNNAALDPNAGNGDEADVGLNNCAIFKNCKCSFNNNEVEHNKVPDLSTVWLNLLEYSPDFASSIASQYGFVKDERLTASVIHTPAAGGFAAYISRNNGGYERRNILTRGALRAAPAAPAGSYPVTIVIPLKFLFQFFRRLTFPIINQLVNFEFELNDHVRSLIAQNPTPLCKLVMNDIVLYAPEVTLPTEINNKFMKMLESGKMVKTLHWDAAEYKIEKITLNNVNFDQMIGTHLAGVRKILCMIRPNPNDQRNIQTTSDISITNFNFEIDSKDLYHMNVQSDIEAYRLISESFNSQGKDVNTGSLLPYDDWKHVYRLYAFDLSRQEVFESDPNVIQSIRFRGTASAVGVMELIVMKNKVTQIDMSNPSNTRTV